MGGYNKHSPHHLHCCQTFVVCYGRTTKIASYRCCTHYLGSGIRPPTLHSDRYYKPWHHSTSAKSILLASIGARCPSIQEFDCEYGNSEESSRVVLKAVCGWHKLVHLSTGALNPQALAHLASLPSLRSLHFVSYDDFDADMQSNCIPTFSFKLDEVSITVPSHSHHIRRLRNVRFLSCRSAALYIDRRKQGLHHGPVDVPDLVISFSECFSPNLEQLKVKTTFDHVKPGLSSKNSTLEVGIIG
ncbi:hypothetical protein K503DRAFT_574177 [Rhizopogon vinicolor AM-OR11-026]|uniref:F-box domain-containing protein n=1 Tax=Rhizopogon vinicolor AM-OR11-026 TaxID=1314800 RepID=A0A1B7MJQ2_9AGAM|nr:hypothetical protein K503DRAFT_574177 [Rhizopogon vinicolor AM-OR11-026]